jgi:predicted RNase H-like nuclease (RuvC/YqgF family)
MLSKALKIQQYKDDEDHETNMSKLHDKVTKLCNSLEEEETEIISLKKNLAKAKEKEQAEKVHNDDMVKMKKQDDSINELRTSLEKEKKDN